MELFQIILIAVLGIYSIIIATKWKEANIWKRIFVFGTIVSVLVVGYNGYEKWRMDAFIKKVEATLGNLSSPKGTEIPYIKIGKNMNGKFRLHQNAILYSGDYQLIKLYTKDKRLYVTTVVRNRDGKPIAAVLDNEWEIYNNDFEYNDDETAFEVVTKGDREVYFQVEFKDSIASISGFLLNREGRGVFLLADPKTHDGSMISSLDIRESDFPNILPVNKRIFKYPRKKYVGERE